jgi:3-hydroxy-D-aspartate aldolase
VDLALLIASAPSLRFAGLQSYHGAAQHIPDAAERQRAIAAAVEKTRLTVDLLRAAGLTCDVVSGGGTGSHAFEAGSGIYNELQCGSYVFMDGDYGRIRDFDGGVVGGFRQALFVLTTVMSKPIQGRAVCDAGLKAHAVDSGLPTVAGRDDVKYVGASDEHGTLENPTDSLSLGEKIRLVPGHCDPTCNLYDWFVGVRGGRVEALWPVTARGKLF